MSKMERFIGVGGRVLNHYGSFVRISLLETETVVEVFLRNKVNPIIIGNLKIEEPFYNIETSHFGHRFLYHGTQFVGHLFG